MTVAGPRSVPVVAGRSFGTDPRECWPARTAAGTEPRRATEAECQRTIVEAARWHGYLIHHCRAARDGSGRYAVPVTGDVGFPDLILVHPIAGVIRAVELKRRPRHLTDDQDRWRAALVHAGVWCETVWVPEELDGFVARLGAWAHGLDP